jgi:hypothetical protein
MIKYYRDLEQGTPEWLQARLGIVTASRVKDLLTGTFKPSKGKVVTTYANELASQRITGRLPPQAKGYHLERGHKEEDLAIAAYENDVESCGIITSDELGFLIGFSPDGLVGEDGLIEVKSRVAKFQVATVLADEVPTEYVLQCQMGLMVTKRKWCDFIQFSNGMPLFVKRVYPDLELHDVIAECIENFEALVTDMVIEYMKKTQGLPELPWVDHEFGEFDEE